jgi:hypothetical protein
MAESVAIDVIETSRLNLRLKIQNPRRQGICSAGLREPVVLSLVYPTVRRRTQQHAQQMAGVGLELIILTIT